MRDVGGVRAQPGERGVTAAGRHARRGPQRVEGVPAQFIGVGGGQLRGRGPPRSTREHLVAYGLLLAAGLSVGVEAVDRCDLHDRVPSVVISRGGRMAIRAR